MRAFPGDSARHHLARIPGRYIVEAMDRLPPCSPDSTVQQLAIDVPLWGPFRVTFRPRQQNLRGLGERWFWIASNAEPLEPGVRQGCRGSTQGNPDP